MDQYVSSIFLFLMEVEPPGLQTVQSSGSQCAGHIPYKLLQHKLKSSEMNNGVEKNTSFAAPLFLLLQFLLFCEMLDNFTSLDLELLE